MIWLIIGLYNQIRKQKYFWRILLVGMHAQPRSSVQENYSFKGQAKLPIQMS